MRRFHTVCLVLAALPAPAVHAQSVRDSVKMTRVPYHWESSSAMAQDSRGRDYYYFNCGAGIVALWPDVLAQNGLPGGYGQYSRVATGGTRAEGYYVPSGYGQATTNAANGIVVPQGFLGHNPQLGGSSSSPIYPPAVPNRASCAQRAANAGVTAAGGTSGVLNAAPFRIEDWYAVYSIPNGTPVALFEWEETEPLSVAFDASFESKQSREADATAPGGKVPVASYRWAFGDGTLGTGATPTHVYADSGLYFVTLEVTDDDGQTSTLSRYVKVERPGLVVWAEALDADPSIRRNELIYLVTHIENRSGAEVRNVRVPYDLAIGTTFPDSVRAATYKAAPSYARETNIGRNDTTIAYISPGEAVHILQYYNAAAYGTYRPRTTWVAVPVRNHAILQGVTATDEQGNAVAVRQKCGIDPCGKTWRLAPNWQMTAELRTDDLLTFEARSGVDYNVALDAPDIAPFNFPPVQPFTYKFVDGTLTRFCHSACVDVQMTVTDAERGAPIANATVIVTAPTLGAGVDVTPDQGGGHLCVRKTASYTCDKTATVTTDEQGRTPPMYYAFPGVIAPTEVQLAVLVRDGSVNIAEQTVPLRILPTERTDFQRTITISQAEAEWINGLLATVTLGTLGNVAGELCEGALKWVLGGGASTGYIIRPGTSSLLHRGQYLLAEWACTLNPFSIWGEETAGNSKKAAETALIAWFGARFQPPDAALGILNGPYPPPFVFYWDGDYYGAVLDAIKAAAPNLAPGATMTLRLYEVSWLPKESVLNGAPMVGNVYFSLETTRYGTTEHTALIELGYDAVRWQSPPSSERLAAILEANAERLRLQESLDRLRRGDFVTIGAGTPTEETVQVTGVSDAGRTERDGEARMDLGAARLRSGPYEVTLSRPLRFSHSSDETLAVLRDTMGVFPPSPPLRRSLDSVSTARPAVLSWRIGALETPATVDVQVARDSLFTTLVLDAPALQADTTHLEVGQLADGERLYWRIRATNLVGEGAWSRPALIIGSDAVPTASDDAAAPAATITLASVSPNPTRGAIRIRYSLPHPATVQVLVFDLLGREVARLHSDSDAAGWHTVDWDGVASSGVYVVRLNATSGTETVTRTQRLVVLH